MLMAFYSNTILNCCFRRRPGSYMNHLQILDKILKADSYDRRATPTSHLGKFLRFLIATAAVADLRGTNGARAQGGKLH